MKILMVVCLCFALPLGATNKAREQRWVEQTVDAIFDGEAIFLEADGHSFLSIYTPSETPGSKGMIVMHGTGFHPDWEQVVQPVRVEMTSHGWHTLSIQMPLLKKEAAYEDYVPLYPEVPARIDAAIEYLRQQGVQTIVIVAHSQGATMAAYYLARAQQDIAAFVAIGMSAQHVQADINSAQSLKNIDIPVLDLYGSKDFATVLATAHLRRNGAAHNPRYVQLIIQDAYHFFDDHNAELINALASWLDATVDP